MSGKNARKLRKSKFPPKKLLALCAGLCVSSVPIAADSEMLVTLFGTVTKPFQAHEMEFGAGGGLKLTYRPIKNINLFAQGEYLSMQMPGIAPITVIDGAIGTGYHLELSDRVGLDFNLMGGAYNAKTTRSISGFTAGASIVFSYKLSPVFSIDTQASGMHYASGSSPLMLVNAAVTPGLTINITELFNKKAKISMELEDLAPVFPALYSWYDRNSFGKIVLTNEEETAINDITVSFFQPQYMAHAKECVTIRNIEPGESKEIDLVAFFNEQMLELTERTDTNSIVIVNYMCLGQKRSKSFPLDVPVYGRNNMSWDDDRRAAVFVSSKDPAAMHFAKYVTSIVREKRRVSVPVNIQYAMGIFEALNQFGINYVVDPSSAFADNVGTAAIDFLQFPYQTLMYKGGDCDDLSILVCSLFEAVGIRTAFITVPGHIFMAFDSGMTVEEANETLRSLTNYIEIDDEVWIPLEITLSDEGFYKAYKYGAREWNKAFEDGTAAIYRMQDSWETYPPISVPGAAANFTMPSNKQVALAFDRSIDQWCFGELRDLLNVNPTKLAAVTEEQEVTTEETVIKEDPFDPATLYDVLSLSGQSVAMLTITGITEERKRDDEEGAEGDGDGDDGDGKKPILGFDPEPDEEDEEDDFEPIEPLIAVDVLGPEALGLVVKDSDKKIVTKFEEKIMAAESKKAEAAAEKKEDAPAEKEEVSHTDAAVVEPVETTVADVVATTEATTTEVTATEEESHNNAVAEGTVIELPRSGSIENTEVNSVAQKVEEDSHTEETSVTQNEVTESQTTTKSHTPAVALTVTGIGLLAAAGIYLAKKKEENKEGDNK